MGWLAQFFDRTYQSLGPAGSLVFLIVMGGAACIAAYALLRPSRGPLLIDTVNESLGRMVAWVGLAMVLVQVVIVIMRYVFAIGSIPVQESILYYHSIIFLVGAGFTLKRDGHVRVDIFYREASPRKKAWIDLFGVLFLLLPVCAATLIYGWGFVLNAWRIGEGSQEPLGLHLVFLLKSLVLVFAIVVALQGLALLIRSWFVITGRLETNQPPSATAGGPEGPAGHDELI